MIENLNMAGLLQLEGTQKKASNEPITLTDAAVEKMKVHQASLAEAKGKSLRIYITAGGCSGYSYGPEGRRPDRLETIRPAYP